ncbi:histidinol dehydrogenase [Hydrogenispora ethanolica]|uniref:Histidinol dehydrogenase n=1 Tax=Hydrogenispora ethanolica TaxID=1082276 RepID=A0A4V2QDI6_HYDET|nr:histidinol dehydrogenase [Hydrogenispora ethanolica]TCL64267.1 histidinol dehydrogenase [Hydrogenispora ethanolica]
MRILTTNQDKTVIMDLLNRRPKFQAEAQLQLSANVAAIMQKVRIDGDAALYELTEKFDRIVLASGTLRVADSELATARADIPASFVTAIRLAKDNILAYHQKQLPKDWVDLRNDGIVLGQRFQAVDSAGLYVPGGIAGTTPLVSSVLMNVLPAVVAGVRRIVICTPPNASGGINPYLLAAAAECGVTEIYKVGGAQAIAALAFGTQSIAPVDVITGPGNQYVTEAKRQVFGYVGLDMLAGPSEILIIADSENKPSYIAADLLSQAEHGPFNEAGAFLLTPSAALAEAVNDEVEGQLKELSRNQVAAASLESNGLIAVTDSLDEAFELANYCAPEHLELLIADPWASVNRIKHAGAIFIGPYSTEPIGDYVAGTNHVLPTNGTARFSSGLNVDHFIKKSSLISYSQAGIERFGPAAITIAGVEGLDAHANAVRLRLNK